MDLTHKRILVTGGAGFLGRHLVAKLEQWGCATVLAPRSALYDLRSKKACREMLQQTQPQLVIHLAAVVGGIGANRQNPGRFFYDNAMMGLQLMEAARRARVEKFVSVGTVCAYPKTVPLPFKESDLWNGYPEETNAPYALAKKMMLVQGQAYRDQYGFNAIHLLPANLYGPGDNADLEKSHVIPAMIRKCLEAKKNGEPEIVLWGDGSPTREFLYVEDAAEAIARASERYNGRDPINIGSGEEISIRKLAGLIARMTGYRGKIVWDRTRPNGQPRRSLDITSAEELFDFRASTSLQDGLETTVSWFESQHISRPKPPRSERHLRPHS